MYLSFYGLSEKPFGQTPDPKFLYWNDAYRETIASLRYGIQERKGFITMIGEAGTGKTTLLRKLLDDLGPDVVSVFLFNPNATFEEILEYTLGELGIPAPAGRKLAMLQRLNEFLLAAFQEGKNTILLIDEAQDLETEVLESLRLLSNLETSKEKILQIVLSGQPELATRLAQDNLRQLKQRIAVRCRLEPLARHELPDFIAARLAVAGGRPDLFAPATLDPIWEFARGIPRLVNAVCDNALLVGYALGRQTIDAAVIGEVITDLTKIDAPIELPIAAPRDAVPVATNAPPPTSAAPVARGDADGVAAAAAPTVAPTAPTAVSMAPDAAPVAHGALPAAAASAPPTTAVRQHTALAEPQRKTPRRAAGFVVAAVVLLALAAVGAFAASRWDEIRPRVRALLNQPGSEVPEHVATSAARPVAPAPAPPPAPVEGGPQGAADAPPPAPGADVGARAHEATPPDPEPVARPQAPATIAEVTAPPTAASSGSDAPAHAAATPPQAVVHAAVPPEPAPARPAPAGPAGVVGGISPAAESASVQIAALPPNVRATSQDLQPVRRGARGGRRVMVQRGDTLMNLASREYGSATYTALDVVRSANPGIQDVDRIIAGSEIVFPDPGPGSRVTGSGEELSVLVGTTPALGQAQELQRWVGARYRLPADLEPIPLGEGRNLYRVSLRNIPDDSEARQIAESLGTILKDPS